VDTNGTIQYLHTDNLGSVRLITDTTGTVVGTNTYNPHGKRVAHTGADSNIGFTGAWTDPTTGLVYLRARDYDPTTGQFLTIDPLADATGQPYTYVNNNPLQYTDPAGLCADCNWLENLVLSGPSNWLADNLQHGPVSHVVSFFEGIGDAASFGLTGIIREAISPGSSCFVKTNSGAYIAGEVSTYLMPFAGGTKALYGVYKGYRSAQALRALETANGATNVANGPRLAQALGQEQVRSLFASTGELKREAIANAKRIQDGTQMNSPYVRRELTSDGSDLADWGKFSTRGYDADNKFFDVHFYMNQKTGKVNYKFDYKTKLQGMDNGPAAQPAIPELINRSGW
jgi:RHS repeat-associated protein